VRTFYLGLVERRAPPEQITQAINQTADWLAMHDRDNYVRTFYLGLVERKAYPEQVAQAISHTTDWLARHDQDTNVRTFYLGLAERKAYPEQITQAINQTAEWLAEHDQDTNVRTFYLGLVERRASKEELGIVAKRTYVWLKKHPGATGIWQTLIAIMIRRHDPLFASEAVTAAISLHPNDQSLIGHYLDLVASQATGKDVEEIFSTLSARFPRNNTIPLRRAKWLSECGRTEEAEAAFGSLSMKYPRSFFVSHAYGRHFLAREKWSEAGTQFKIALGLHQGFQLAHEGSAQALRGLAAKATDAGDTHKAEKNLQRAERHFRSAIYWAKRRAAPLGYFYAAIGWFYLDQKACEEALGAFQSAIRENSEDFANYWGEGAALKCLRRYSEALDSLNSALSKAPQPFKSPAREEIPKLIEQCRNELDSLSKQ
jgi:tetratricopeptide (TPR) repeat protein